MTYAFEGEIKTFDDFWACYPRRTHKAQARKAWAKLNPDYPTMYTIFKNLESRASTGEWSNKQFIPHAATYLNNERWEDEPVEDKPLLLKPSTSTKDRTLQQDLEDRSWAH